ncbi:unnamed protein product [Camellia sinensis]
MEINDEINMKVKKYLRGEGANLEGLRDKKLKGQLAIREELYGKFAKAVAKLRRLNNIKTVHDNSLLVEETVREPNVHVEEDIRLEEYVCSDCSFNSDTQDVGMTKNSSSNCGSDSHTEDVEMDVSLPSVCISDSGIMGRESIDDQSREADLDSLYQKYTDRMRWLDLLNHDRTCG